MDNLNVRGVYKILCLVNGKFYIGSSKNIKTRWREHWNERERAKTKNQMMYDDMRKYGSTERKTFVFMLFMRAMTISISRKWLPITCNQNITLGIRQGKSPTST